MTEWGVVGVIIALAGLVSAIVAPLIKLNTTITKLTVIVERLEHAQTAQETKASESHRRLWDHNGEQDKRLDDHERRISAVERQ